MITGRFTLGYADQLQAYWDQSRAIRIATFGILAAFALLLVFEIDTGQFGIDTFHDALWLAPLLAIGAWFGLVAWAIGRMSPQQLDVSYLIDDERIAIRDAAGNEVSSPWREIRECEERKRGLVLKIGPGARWLCKRAFAPDALAAFRKLARERLGNNARLMVGA